MSSIHIPAEEVPLVADVDICVIGGSCTGVFAAVRAARLGARVAIVERQGCFGGVATSGLVSIWHSLHDEAQTKQIIGGLTLETVERLKKRDAVHISDHRVDVHHLNTEELKIELDELVTEHGITPFLNTLFSGVHMKGDQIDAVIVQKTDGRAAIRAAQFVDATGDGRVARSTGLPVVEDGAFQPPSMCAKIWGMHTLGDWNWKRAVEQHGQEFGLEPDWGWSTWIPGVPGLEMHADTHVFDVDTAQSDVLTSSEIEGRRKVRAVMDIIRKYGPAPSTIGLADIAATIGVRETSRVRAQYSLTGDDVLYGKRFEDAIANGSYRVDIHHDDGPGITFRYLDGTEVVIPSRGAEKVIGRWREPMEVDPTFYQIPLRSITPRTTENLMLSGRMLDATKDGFSAVRVMVNMNQTGEAAGTAAFLSLDANKPVQNVAASDVRRRLSEGGSIVE